MTSVLKRGSQSQTRSVPAPSVTAEIGPAAGRFAVAVAFENDGIALVESAELATLPVSARQDLLTSAAEALIGHIRTIQSPRERS